MLYTQFISGDYALRSIADPLARGRNHFENVEGTLVLRRINLCRVPPDAFNLHERPEYTPLIHIFQLKRLQDNPLFQFVQFSQKYFVHNDFLATLERFLRQNVTEVSTPDMDKVPEEFLHYYNTDFALVTCDYERITAHKRISEVGDTEVLQPLASATRFKGVDFKAGATLRMLEPNLLEKKLQEIEEKAAYYISIAKVKDVIEHRELLYYEHKEAWDHFVIERS